MLQIIGCDHCKKEGTLPVNFSIDVKVDTCTKCQHINVETWTFYFCDTQCFGKWLAKVKKKGIPCRGCRGTGWSSGYKFNGQCFTCMGKGSLKFNKF